MDWDCALLGSTRLGPGLHPSQINLDNPEVVQAVRAGDGEAIARVLEVCLPALRQLASNRFGLSAEESDDVLQEVRIAFWRAATRFRGECSLRTYLVQITRRKCIDHVRARERQASDALDSHNVEGRNDPAVETAADRLAMERAMAQLTPRQRQVLDLYYVQGRSYQEVAAAMGIAIGTVGAMKAAALDKLRSTLSGDAMGTGRSEE